MSEIGKKTGANERDVALLDILAALPENTTAHGIPHVSKAGGMYTKLVPIHLS